MSCMGHNELLIKADKHEDALGCGFCSLLAIPELLSRENLTFYELLVRKQSQAGGLGHCGDVITLIVLKDLRFPKKLGDSHRCTPHTHTLFSSAWIEERMF